MNFLKCSKTARLILWAIFPTLPNVLRIFCLPKKNRDVMILKFNGLRGEFQINYACGYAYSEDYPGLTLLDLLNEADLKMYDDKIRTKKDQKNIR